MIWQKYHAWNQQKGKSQMKCMQEYVLLICAYSPELATTLEQVLNGSLTQINYKSKNINDNPGGALQKSVPKPKNVHAEENKKFVAGLNNREKVLKDLYENIRQTKDANKLVQLVKDGTIKPNERNGLG